MTWYTVAWYSNVSIIGAESRRCINVGDLIHFKEDHHTASPGYNASEGYWLVYEIIEPTSEFQSLKCFISNGKRKDVCFPEVEDIIVVGHA